MENIHEKINVQIYESALIASKKVASEIIQAIKQKQAQNLPIVIGFATGSTPILLYKELVQNFKENKISFKNVIAFNLDEYYPISRKAVQSYWHFMHHHLFNHIDILPQNINIPNGEWSKDELKDKCNEYDKKIDDLGGIDIQLLGIGQNGHIGFNEPGSSFYSKTRLIHLDYNTRIINSPEFQNSKEVPLFALTVGIETILKSKQIILLAWGPQKSTIIANAVEGNITEHIPATVLQKHKNCTFYIDAAASTELTSVKKPWILNSIEWTPTIIKRAVIDLSFMLKKPILSLTTSDYLENGLSELLFYYGGQAYQLNLEIFYALRDTITGWPAGKPNAVIPAHPERSEPYPKKIIIFSPHPDDDIISMGGTFIRLHEQGNDVHVAYQTSGNIAVKDEFAQRFIQFAHEFQHFNKHNENSLDKTIEEINTFIQNKSNGEKDIEMLRQIKGLIRKCEAVATCKYVGLTADKAHFMNLPFYETGEVVKKPMSEKDIEITIALLNKIQPHQIYCAGDLADPHGTHKVCLEIVQESVSRIKAANPTGWIKDCWMWLYKGAWHEWSIDEIEMTIPMSPEQVIQKRFGIYIHQSQKDIVPFQGADNREFWQRAEERNAETAQKFASLGLTKYAAMESFVRWKF